MVTETRIAGEATVTEGSSAAKRVLYVAWGFPPFSGSGVWTPLACVNALAARGHQVTVLTADADTFAVVQGGDPGLVDRVDPRVKVVRVPMPPSQKDPVLNRWSKHRVLNQAEWIRLAEDRWRGVFPEPLGTGWFPQWYPAAGAAARRLHQAEGFDLVLATASPWVDFSVPLRLNLDTDVPFVLYDRDSWLFNVFTGEPYPQAPQIRPLLDLALSRCVQAWYINPPIAELHQREFPQHAAKIQAVCNGWDPEFVPGDITPPPRQPDRPLVFRYVGTMVGFPLGLALEGWKQARAASPALTGARFELVGPGSPQQLVDQPDHGIFFTGPKPRTELPDLYRQTDALVFLKEGGGLVTSGKVYEYVATGLPVVSAIDLGHDARRVLGGRPLWFDAAELTPAALADALVAAAEHVPAEDEVAAALRHGLAFGRPQVLAAAFDQLEVALGWA